MVELYLNFCFRFHDLALNELSTGNWFIIITIIIAITVLFIIAVFLGFVPCSTISNRRFRERVLHGSKPQKTAIIDTAIKASKKTEFYELQ
jgi:hypothetical protein